MRIDKSGIWFIHAKKKPIYIDEVCWLWWWRRRGEGGKKIMSMGFNASFKSLKELDETWEGYCEAIKSSPLEEPYDYRNNEA